MARGFIDQVAGTPPPPAAGPAGGAPAAAPAGTDPQTAAAIIGKLLDIITQLPPDVLAAFVEVLIQYLQGGQPPAPGGTPPAPPAGAPPVMR